MPTISALTSFTPNTKIKSSEVNANFSAIRTTVNTYAAFVDLAATISGTWTFTTAPTLQAGATVTTGGITITAGGLTVTAGGVTVSAGGIAVTGNSTITGTLTVSSTVSGVGSGLTALNASELGSGTVPDARFPATLPAVSGANLTALNASNISSGTLNSARLPATIAANTTGSAQSLLNGSNSIQIGGSTVITIASGSGSGVTGVTASVGAFEQGPNGFTTFSAQSAFIPVSIAGTAYFIRCERWT